MIGFAVVAYLLVSAGAARADDEPPGLPGLEEVVAPVREQVSAERGRAGRSEAEEPPDESPRAIERVRGQSRDGGKRAEKVKAAVSRAVEPAETESRSPETAEEPRKPADAPVQRITEPLETATKPAGKTLKRPAEPLETATKPLDKTLKRAAEPLETATKPLKRAAEPLETATKPLGETLERATKPLETATKPLGETLERATKPLEPATSSLGRTIRPVVEPVVKSVEPVTRPLTTTLESAAKPLTTTLNPVLRPITTPLTPALDSVAGSLAPLKPAVESVTGSLAPLKPTTDPVAGSLAPVLPKPVGQVVQPVVTAPHPQPVIADTPPISAAVAAPVTALPSTLQPEPAAALRSLPQAAGQPCAERTPVTRHRAAAHGEPGTVPMPAPVPAYLGLVKCSATAGADSAPQGWAVASAAWLPAPAPGAVAVTGSTHHQGRRPACTAPPG